MTLDLALKVENKLFGFTMTFFYVVVGMWIMLELCFSA